MLAESKAAQRRRITIPVDVPQMRVVHTVSLNLLEPPANANSQVRQRTVGQAIPAELKLKQSREWDIQSGEERNRSETLSFCYELEASPDIWLIGGQRKAQFVAKVQILLHYVAIFSTNSILGQGDLDIFCVVDSAASRSPSLSKRRSPTYRGVSERERRGKPARTAAVPDEVAQLRYQLPKPRSINSGHSQFENEYRELRIYQG